MDISSIFQTWVNVLTKPGEEVFAAEREKSSATLSTALVWIIASSAIAALLGLLQAQIFSSAMGGMGQIVRLLPAELRGEFGTITETGAAGGTIASLSLIIIGPIGFLIGVGILHLFATVLGGRGQYGRYAYLTAAFSAPLTILSSLLGFVPVVGGCVSVILSIYQLALAYYATRVEYRLSQGRAIVVVVAPVLPIRLLAGCVMFVVFGLLVATFSSGS